MGARKNGSPISFYLFIYLGWGRCGGHFHPSLNEYGYIKCCFRNRRLLTVLTRFQFWLTDWLNVWLAWLAGWLCDWFTEWLTNRMADLFEGSLVNRTRSFIHPYGSIVYYYNIYMGDFEIPCWGSTDATVPVPNSKDLAKRLTLTRTARIQ